LQNSAANAQNKLQATQTGQHIHRQQKLKRLLQSAKNKKYINTKAYCYFLWCLYKKKVEQQLQY